MKKYVVAVALLAAPLAFCTPNQEAEAKKQYAAETARIKAEFCKYVLEDWPKSQNFGKKEFGTRGDYCGVDQLEQLYRNLLERKDLSECDRDVLCGEDFFSSIAFMLGEINKMPLQYFLWTIERISKKARQLQQGGILYTISSPVGAVVHGIAGLDARNPLLFRYGFMAATAAAVYYYFVGAKKEVAQDEKNA